MRHIQRIRYVFHKPKPLFALQVRTSTKGDGDGGVVRPIASGPFPHGFVSGVIEQGAKVTIPGLKARLLVAV